MQPLRVLVSANKSYTTVRDVPPVLFVMLFVQALTLIPFNFTYLLPSLFP